MKTIQRRISDNLECLLAAVYDEQQITSGDVTPEQFLTWERLTQEMADLFAELIEQNK